MTPPTRHTGNTPAPEVVEATATQIQAIIDRLPGVDGSGWCR
ncbi:hypothetical protein [Actinomyces qiguomingii]|nr:hypothetical protein [Actinomyces qiguomingii]